MDWPGNYAESVGEKRGEKEKEGNEAVWLPFFEETGIGSAENST